MVPGQATMIPVFITMRDWGLLNSYIALTLPIVNVFSFFL
jgi:ABC-type glycerol-3-phosphate transport system permease component